MGWREQDRLPPEIFSETLAKMKPGEISDVLAAQPGFTSSSFMIDGVPAAAPSWSSRRMCGRLRAWASSPRRPRRTARSGCSGRASSRGRASPRSARLNSDDTASATRGGDLGWIVPGDLVPEFDRAIHSLKPGELSSRCAPPSAST